MSVRVVFLRRGFRNVVSDAIGPTDCASTSKRVNAASAQARPALLPFGPCVRSARKVACLRDRCKIRPRLTRCCCKR